MNRFRYRRPSLKTFLGITNAKRPRSGWTELGHRCLEAVPVVDEYESANRIINGNWAAYSGWVNYQVSAV
jgi:hypothetical protein